MSLNLNEFAKETGAIRTVSIAKLIEALSEDDLAQIREARNGVLQLNWTTISKWIEQQLDLQEGSLQGVSTLSKVLREKYGIQ